MTDQVFEKDRWMTDLLPHIAGKKLAEVCLPGTHQSAMYSFSDTYMDAYQNDMLTTIQTAADQESAKLTGIKPLADFIDKQVRFWSQTQKWTISEQLLGGIRYLDLRVMRWNGDFHVFHGYVGVSLKSVLEEICAFLRDGRTELVLVSFSHLKNMHSEFVAQDHLDCIALIKSVLGTLLYDPVRELSNKTLGEILHQGSSVIGFYGEPAYQDTLLGAEDSFYKSRSVTDNNGIADASALYAAESESVSAGATPGTMIKVDWTLTPSADSIQHSLLNMLDATAAAEDQSWLNRQVSGLLRRFMDEHPQGMNLITVDFADSSAVVDLAIRRTLGDNALVTGPRPPAPTFDTWKSNLPVVGSASWASGYGVRYTVGFEYADGTVVRGGWLPAPSSGDDYFGNAMANPRLTSIGCDPTGQAVARRIYRQFRGEAERLVARIPNNTDPDVYDMDLGRPVGPSFGTWAAPVPADASGSWVAGYGVRYAVAFEFADGKILRGNYWKPDGADGDGYYAGTSAYPQLTNIVCDPTDKAVARRIYRQFRGEPEQLLARVPNNTDTTFTDMDPGGPSAPALGSWEYTLPVSGSLDWVVGGAVRYRAAFEYADGHIVRGAWWNPDNADSDGYLNLSSAYPRLTNLACDPTAQAVARCVYRQFRGGAEDLVLRIPNNTETERTDRNPGRPPAPGLGIWTHNLPLIGSSSWVIGCAVRYSMGYELADGSVVRGPWWSEGGDADGYLTPNYSCPQLINLANDVTGSVARRIYRQFRGQAEQMVARLPANPLETTFYEGNGGAPIGPSLGTSWGAALPVQDSVGWVTGAAVRYAVAFEYPDGSIVRGPWWSVPDAASNGYLAVGKACPELIIPCDRVSQAIGRRIYRQFRGQLEQLVGRIDNNTDITFADQELALPSGSWLNFGDNCSSAVNLGNPAKLNISGPISIALWIYPLATDGSRTIISRRSPSTSGGEVSLRIVNGNYQLGCSNGADHFATAHIPADDVDEWVHLVGVYDGTQWILYHNCQVRAQLQGPGPLPINAGWVIGSRAGTTDSAFRGLIYQVSIWNTALDAAGVQRCFNNGLTGREPGLIGHWPLDDGGGLTIRDRSLHPAVGTLVNTSWIPPSSLPPPGHLVSVGDAMNASAMAWHEGALYMVSSNKLWKRGNLEFGSGNDWTEAGDAIDVAALTSHQGSLYALVNNQLGKRGQLGPGSGNDWTAVGDAIDVTALTSHQGALYVTANNQLWKRGQLGPGTGSDWTAVGDAANVTAMTSHRASLYALANEQLWRRGKLGPGSGSDWTAIDNISTGAAMASSGSMLYFIVDSSLYCWL